MRRKEPEGVTCVRPSETSAAATDSEIHAARRRRRCHGDDVRMTSCITSSRYLRGRHRVTRHLYDRGLYHAAMLPLSSDRF